MKKITCKDLAGACGTVITGEAFEEMGENSKKHAMKMVQAGDKVHIEAMEAMMKLSKEEQMKWFNKFADSFESLPDA